jgi:hypothetical protein
LNAANMRVSTVPPECSVAAKPDGFATRAADLTRA